MFSTVSYFMPFVNIFQMLLPMLSNNANHSKWPSVVSQDIVRQMGTLKSEVFVFSGQVKGRTLLPLPPQTDSVIKAIEIEER